MIIPDKNIRLQNSLLGMGSHILTKLNEPETVSSLWEQAKQCHEINSFDKFVYTLDLLFMLDLIELSNGLVRKVEV